MDIEKEKAQVYEGRALQCIRFPLGGAETGRVNLTGRGALEDWQLDGEPGNAGRLPRTFAAIFAHAARHRPVARVLEAHPFPPCAEGPSAPGEGLPRMASVRFRGESPFACVTYADPALPVRVELEAFSPFFPGEPAIPGTVLRYTIANESGNRARVTLMWSLLNIAGRLNSYVDEEGVRGLLLGGDRNSMAILTPHRGVIFTTHWLRAPDAIATREFWNTFAATGYVPYHEYGPAEEGNPEAGAVAVRLAIKPGAEKTVVFYITWHFPDTTQAILKDALAAGQSLHTRLAELETKTRTFHNALYSTTAPREILHAASASIVGTPPTTCAEKRGGERPSVDTQLASVVVAYRHWKLSGDETRLSATWPRMKTMLQNLRQQIDPRDEGIPSRPVTVAGGVEIAGASPLPAFLYLGALAAGAELADWAGDRDAADAWRVLHDRGLESAEQRLWQHNLYVQPPEDDSQAEYDLAGACLSTSLLGVWLCELAGLGPLVQPRRLRKALQTIVQKNWRDDLTGHPNPGRVFAYEGEPGLLMCTFPRGARPGSAPPWADEVWPEVEYMLAAHCFHAGLFEEGLKLVQGVRLRYDGLKRNPWTAHPAASDLIPALSGFRCDRGAGVIGFAPRLPEPFRTFWSVEGAWGTYEQAEARATLQVLAGKLVLNRIDLPTLLDQTPWEMTLLKKTRTVHPGEFGSITFRRALTLKPGQQLVLAKQGVIT